MSPLMRQCLALAHAHWLKPDVLVKAFYQMSMCHSHTHSHNIAKPLKPTKRKGVIERERHFVDFVKVTVRGGKGGDGLQAFSSLPNMEWAGPDGGNGGNGGHVVFKASHNRKSLSHLRHVIGANNGIRGKTRRKDGKNADHLYIEVPLGTIVRSKDEQVLTSLDCPDDIFVAARGGAGGRGNSFFLSNENRAPVISEPGGPGQERTLMVELKTMAHAGLIGFPNAGKSSLLQAISRAQPKVSPYPFTTLNPHVGMVLYDDHVQIAVADIPGLIPGSYQNKGMGISFLRHIERCLCLIFVIDLALEHPWEQLYRLCFELDQYQEGLSRRPSLLVANKIDLPGAPERMEKLKEKLRNDGKRLINDNVNVLDKRSETDVSQKYYESVNVNANISIVYDEGEEIDVSKSVSKWTSVDGVERYGNVINDDGEDSMIILGLSAKKKIGVDELLHYLRVLYDKHSF